MKLKDLFSEKKDITIAYLGGSITQAHGYRDIFTAYLKETYPQNNITEINAGISGANSFLGLEKTDDVISQKPDIVVIDFTVSDNHIGEYNRAFGFSYEGIIRKLADFNPDIIIIIGIGFTTDEMNTVFYDKGTYPFSVKIHRFICEQYKIPYINVGEMLYKHIKETNETMADYSCDNKANKFCGEAFIDAIADYDFPKKKLKKILFTK